MWARGASALCTCRGGWSGRQPATVYKWNQTPPVVINHNEENLPRSGEKGCQISEETKDGGKTHSTLRWEVCQCVLISWHILAQALVWHISLFRNYGLCNLCTLVDDQADEQRQSPKSKVGGEEGRKEEPPTLSRQESHLEIRVRGRSGQKSRTRRAAATSS